MNWNQDVFVIGRKYDSAYNAFDELLKENTENLKLIIESIQPELYGSLIYLSTCNRVEIIGRGDVHVILQIMAKEFPFLSENLNRLYCKTGEKAVTHLFVMPSGLDSNVLGDLEILGQFKMACKVAKKNNRLCKLMERLINISLQSSKEIRQKTAITSGTSSLSYAAIQILKNREIKDNQSILLIGLGKFGKSIAKNIRQYFPNNSLSVVNRTLAKSKEIAKELHTSYLEYEKLDDEMNNFDILISAIGQVEVKNNTLFSTKSPKIIIDLSVPSFFNPQITNNHNIDFINIAEASSIVNQSILKRKESLPKAYNIIDKYINDFYEWVEINEDYLKLWKNNVLEVMSECDAFKSLESETNKQIFNKSIGDYVVYVKNNKANLTSKDLLMNYLDSNLEDNCLLQKYSNIKTKNNCKQCRNKFL